MFALIESKSIFWWKFSFGYIQHYVEAITEIINFMSNLKLGIPIS